MAAVSCQRQENRPRMESRLIIPQRGRACDFPECWGMHVTLASHAQTTRQAASTNLTNCDVSNTSWKKPHGIKDLEFFGHWCSRNLYPLSPWSSTLQQQGSGGGLAPPLPAVNRGRSGFMCWLYGWPHWSPCIDLPVKAHERHAYRHSKHQ